MYIPYIFIRIPILSNAGEDIGEGNLNDVIHMVQILFHEIGLLHSGLCNNIYHIYSNISIPCLQ